MTVLDIGNNITVSNSLPPESTTSASVRNGASFDTRGYTWGVALFIMGNMDAAATEAFAVEDSADDASFAVCDKVGSDAGAADATIAAAVYADNSVAMIAIDFTNTRRYVRCTAKCSTADAQAYNCVIVGMPNYTGDAAAPSFDV